MHNIFSLFSSDMALRKITNLSISTFDFLFLRLTLPNARVCGTYERLLRGSDIIMARPVQQIQMITEDLRKLKLKVELLAGDRLLSRRQRAVVEQLEWSLDGVRGWELGIARQAFGLDELLIQLTQDITMRASHEKGVPG